MLDLSKYPLPKRMRHHTSPNVYLPASELNHLPDGYPELIEKIDWSEHFANALPPDILDIGCGRGKFLLELAFNNPSENHLGIEVRPLPAEWLKNVISGESFSNVSVIRYSVVNGLPFISDNSISKVFYLFPDPWQKKKHIKRRAFNLNFVQEIYRILKNGDALYLATDVLEIDEYHKEVLKEFGKFNCEVVETDENWKFPITNKEDFCRKMNISFYRIICRK